MKIYTLNMGYRGGIVVVASSREEAFELMKAERFDILDSDLDDISEADVADGCVFNFWGDT